MAVLTLSYITSFTEPVICNFPTPLDLEHSIIRTFPPKDVQALKKSKKIKKIPILEQFREGLNALCEIRCRKSPILGFLGLLEDRQRFFKTIYFLIFLYYSIDDMRISRLRICKPSRVFSPIIEPQLPRCRI